MLKFDKATQSAALHVPKRMLLAFACILLLAPSPGPNPLGLPAPPDPSFVGPPAPTAFDRAMIGCADRMFQGLTGAPSPFPLVRSNPQNLNEMFPFPTQFERIQQALGMSDLGMTDGPVAGGRSVTAINGVIARRTVPDGPVAVHITSPDCRNATWYAGQIRNGRLELSGLRPLEHEIGGGTVNVYRVTPRTGPSATGGGLGGSSPSNPFASIGNPNPPPTAAATLGPLTIGPTGLSYAPPPGTISSRVHTVGGYAQLAAQIGPAITNEICVIGPIRTRPYSHFFMAPSPSSGTLNADGTVSLPVGPDGRGNAGLAHPRGGWTIDRMGTTLYPPPRPLPDNRTFFQRLTSPIRGMYWNGCGFSWENPD